MIYHISRQSLVYDDYSSILVFKKIWLSYFNVYHKDMIYLVTICSPGNYVIKAPSLQLLTLIQIQCNNNISSRKISFHQQIIHDLKVTSINQLIKNIFKKCANFLYRHASLLQSVIACFCIHYIDDWCTNPLIYSIKITKVQHIGLRFWIHKRYLIFSPRKWDLSFLCWVWAMLFLCNGLLHFTQYYRQGWGEYQIYEYAYKYEYL